MTPDTFGTRLHSRRKALGLTLDTLAAKADLSKTFLSELENNLARPGGDTLLSLSQALGVTLDWLMVGDPAPALGRWDASIPAPLAALAAAEDLSYRTVALLVALRGVLAVHRREKPGAAFDWAKFYGRIKEWV